MLRGLTERGKVVVASVVSLLLHLLMAGLASLLLAFRGQPELSPKLPVPEEIELTIVRPTPSPTPPIRFVETPKDRASERPPKNPVFESDADSLAASEQPAKGDLPVPSQEGLDLPGITLDDRQLALAQEAATAAAQAALESAPPPLAPAPMPTPALRKTESDRQPQATPPPDALALLDPASRSPRHPTPTPTPEPTPQKNPIPPQPTPHKQQDASPPSYQPDKRTNKIVGSVDSRGRSSVDSVATPLGRYRKALSDAIGSRWYFYTTSRMDLISLGTVRLRFFVKADGSVEDIEILSNTSNASFGTFTLQAVLEAEIPPIPPDIAQTLENNRLEVEYTFTVYGGR